MKEEQSDSADNAQSEGPQIEPWQTNPEILQVRCYSCTGWQK